MALLRRSGAVIAASILISILAVVPAPGSATETGDWDQPMRGFNANAAMTIPRLDDLVDATGANLIRLSFGYSAVHLMSKVSTTGSTTDPNGDYPFDEDSFDKLDAVLDWAETKGVRIVIDPHTAPGFASDYTTSPTDPFWQDAGWRQHLVDLWVEIATRHRDRGSVIAGYELMNEPALPDPAKCGEQWNDVVAELVDAIRNTGDDHPIVVQAAGYKRGSDCQGRGGGYELRTEGVADLVLPDDDNLVVSAHFYVPYAFAHQGQSQYPDPQAYPGELPDGRWADRALVSNAMADLREFQSQNDVPIFIGEFSASRAGGPQGDVWLRDVLDLMEDQNWSWAYHEYGPHNPSSCAWNPLKPYTSPPSNSGCSAADDPTTPRSELLTEYMGRNHSTAPSNRAPVAVASTLQCIRLTCTFDGTFSIDTDGTVASYTWDFGDQTATGAVVSHTFPGPGTHTIHLTVSDDDGRTATSIPHRVEVVDSSEFPESELIVEDNFDDGTTPGWGTSDTGQAWTTSGYHAQFHTEAGAGVLTVNTPGKTGTASLESLRVGDLDWTTTFSVEGFATGGGTYLSWHARRSAPATYYRAMLRLMPNGTIQSHLARVVDGSVTALGTVGHPDFSYTPGERMRMRLRIQGNQLRLRVWPENQIEPSTWTVGATDTAPELVGPGSVSFAGYIAGDATLPLTVGVHDSTLIGAPLAAADTFTRSVTGGWGTSDVGGPWSTVGYFAEFDVDGDSANIMSPPGKTGTATLAGTNFTDSDVVMSMHADRLATGGGAYTSIQARQQGPGTLHKATVRFLDDGKITAYLIRSTSAGTQTLSWVNLTDLAYAPNRPLRVRFQIVGNHLRLRLWDAAQPEPVEWTLTADDPYLSQLPSGPLSISHYVAGSEPTPVTVSIDSLSVRHGL